jgi:hypothetical protein
MIKRRLLVGAVAGAAVLAATVVSTGTALAAAPRQWPGLADRRCAEPGAGHARRRQAARARRLTGSGTVKPVAGTAGADTRPAMPAVGLTSTSGPA